MKSLYALIFILILAIAAQATTYADEPIQRLSSDEFKTLKLPFSQAVQVGGILYLSGELGVIPGKLELVAGGVTPETRQALENIKATLLRFGSSMDRVIKCTLFLADIAEWQKVNVVYMEYFANHLPARSAVAGSGLGLGARVEIECMALAGDE